MIQTRNYVGAALFRLEAASQLWLNSSSCTSKACEWLPRNTAVKPMKIKDMKLCRNDFGARGKTKGALHSSPKKDFIPIEKSSYSLSREEIAHAVSSVCKESECIIFSALPEHIAIAELQEIPVKTHTEWTSESKDAQEYLNALAQISRKDTLDIERFTKGQSETRHGFHVGSM